MRELLPGSSWFIQELLISLPKASELLEITRDELTDILKKRGIPIRTLSKEDVIAEVEAIKWF